MVVCLEPSEDVSGDGGSVHSLACSVEMYVFDFLNFVYVGVVVDELVDVGVSVFGVYLRGAEVCVDIG